jgi:hypothetical protein
MTLRKCLILQVAAATFFSGVSACSGGGAGGGGGSDFAEFAGAYTLVYERVAPNSNCTDEDPDWIQGILILDESGELDFGLDYQVDAQLTDDAAFEFDQDLTDPAGLVHVSGIGTFVMGTSLRIVGGDDDGIVADYANDCRVRGTYSGARTISSGGG